MPCGSVVAGVFGDGPAVLARQVREQPEQEPAGPAAGLHAGEPAGHPIEQPVGLGRPPAGSTLWPTATA